MLQYIHQSIFLQHFRLCESIFQLYQFISIWNPNQGVLTFDWMTLGQKVRKGMSNISLWTHRLLQWVILEVPVLKWLKKIGILRAVHVVELSWASIVIILNLKCLYLGCRALPWTSHWSLENKKYQIAKIQILSADSKSAWKTVSWKCFSFYQIPSGSLSKSMLKIF